MKFSAYEDYKPSEIDWLPLVPAHWPVKGLRYVCRFAYGDSLAAENREDGDIAVYGSNGQVGTHNSANTLAPVIVVGRKGSFGKLNYSSVPVFAIDTTYYVDTRCTSEQLDWLAYALQPLKLDEASKDSAVPGLAREDAYKHKVPVPPQNEQKAITRFLDAKTAQIDELVAKKRQLIAKLKEKRSALIARTVTRGLPPEAAKAAGLEPNPEMKDSGISWIGEIAQHWRVVSYKRLCSRVDVGIAEAATHAYCDDGVPIIRSKNVKADGLETSDLIYIEPWFAEKNKSKILRAGDLVTVRTGYPGTTAVVPPELDGCQCFTLVMSSVLGGVHSPFIVYFANSVGMRYFEVEAWGSAQANISVPIVQLLLVAVPPLGEQRAIAAYLDRETEKLDRLTAGVETAVDRLTEYRQALITAAVTGTIDVRNARNIHGVQDHAPTALS